METDIHLYNIKSSCSLVFLISKHIVDNQSIPTLYNEYEGHTFRGREDGREVLTPPYLTLMADTGC